MSRSISYRINHHRHAFTLIELLIVVAIIAILAAIAVPNFLEAQTRAKVARAKADMRSIATAMESYSVDNNRPSPVFNSALIVTFPWGTTSAETRQLRFAWLTTPIAYFSVAPIDPFNTDNSNDSAQKIFVLQSEPAFTAIPGDPYSGAIGPVANTYKQSWNTIHPMWLLLSRGPDKIFDRTKSTYSAAIGVLDYDPTNGTISDGDIIRHRE